MGAVVDRLSITRTEVKSLLGLDGNAQDQLIDLLITAGKEIADEYLNNPFTDADDVALPIPNAVKLGLVIWIESELDRVPGDAIYVKTGDITVRYSTDKELPDKTLRHWDLFRLSPTKTAGSTTVSWSLGAP